MSRSRKIDYSINDSGCFEVTSHSPRKKGYFMIMINKKYMFAHRHIYEECFGEIPDGLFVRHKCDNRFCINPEHLELGTHRDNTDDMMIRDRQAKGSRNGKSILTEDQVIEIRKSKDKYKDISKKYGIAVSTIEDIRGYRRWKHI